MCILEAGENVAAQSIVIICLLVETERLRTSAMIISLASAKLASDRVSSAPPSSSSSSLLPPLLFSTSITVSASDSTEIKKIQQWEVGNLVVLPSLSDDSSSDLSSDDKLT